MTAPADRPGAPPLTMHDDTLRQFSGYRMKRAFNAIQADLAATLAPFGLRMLTFSALVVIVDNPGRRQSQLADALSIERPNLVILVDELERAGLITRTRTPEDRRAYALRATAAGRRVFDQALRAVRDHEARMTSGVAPDDRAAMMRALQSIETAQTGGKPNGPSKPVP